MTSSQVIAISVFAAAVLVILFSLRIMEFIFRCPTGGKHRKYRWAIVPDEWRRDAN